MVVRQIDVAQVLEVTKVLFDNLHDVLRIKFRLDGFVRELYSARVKNQETIQKFAMSSLECLGILEQIRWNVLALLWLLLWKLESPLSLNWVNDSVNGVFGHLVRHSYNFLLSSFPNVPRLISVHRSVGNRLVQTSLAVELLYRVQGFLIKSAILNVVRQDGAVLVGLKEVLTCLLEQGITSSKNFAVATTYVILHVAALELTASMTRRKLVNFFTDSFQRTSLRHV